MSWYNRAQQIIDTTDPDYNPESYSSNPRYIEIGHMEDEGTRVDNYLWAIINGVLEVVTEKEYDDEHSAIFPQLNRKMNYKGRYDSNTGLLSISKPERDQFRNVPGQITRMLQRRFPEAKEFRIFY